MLPAQHRTEGAPRPFLPLEYASAKTVADVTRAELLANPLHPKLDADRPVRCECGCASVGIHNALAYRLSAV